MSSAARARAGVRVAVTGAGVVSPIGNDLVAFDEALRTRPEIAAGVIAELVRRLRSPDAR